MKIDCLKADDGTPVMHLAGRLDFTKREEFVGALDHFLGQVTAPEVHVNCASLDYLDSSGLGMLLILRDRASQLGCTVALVECTPAVRDILTTVQFGRLFRLA